MDVVTSIVKPLKNDKFFPLCGQCFHLFCFRMFYFALVKIWLLRTVQVTLKIFRTILLRFSLFFLLPDKIYYRWRVLAWVLKIGQISWDVSPAILRAQAVAECLMEKQVISDPLGSCELSTKNRLFINEPNRYCSSDPLQGKKKKWYMVLTKSQVPMIVHCLLFDNMWKFYYKFTWKESLRSKAHCVIWKWLFQQLFQLCHGV